MLQTLKGCVKVLMKSLYKVRSFLLPLLLPAEVCLLELGEWVTIPTTYAGGAKCMQPPVCVYSDSTNRWYPAITDLKLVDDLSGGKVDLTFGR